MLDMKTMKHGFAVVRKYGETFFIQFISPA